MSDEKRLNIYQRMHEVMTKCTYVKKDANKVAGQYTAVKHDDVTAKVRPYLLEAGVLPITSVVNVVNSNHLISKKGYQGAPDRQVMSYRAEAEVIITFACIDDKEDAYTVRAFGTGDDMGDKAVGKAISYAAKYAMLKALMLETGDDADHDASVAHSVPDPRIELFQATFKGVPDEPALKALWATLSPADQVACESFKDEAKLRIMGLAS